MGGQGAEGGQGVGKGQGVDGGEGIEEKDQTKKSTSLPVGMV